MKPAKTLAILAFLALGIPFAGAAQDASALIVITGDAADLNEFLWIKRPIVVFADSPADPRFDEQMRLLQAEANALALRDVVVLTDTDPAALGPLRRALRPRGFALVLVDKDGQVKQRKPAPMSVREISRFIDALPTRQQEIRDGLGKE